MRYVVAVTAPMGGGKTSLVNALADQINNATAIYCDHYERITEQSAQRIMEWLKRGANADEFMIPQLPHDLEKLKHGESVIDPLTNIVIPSKKYIIFETNFGRLHRATGRHIDLLIWIETPLDIALARKIKAFTGEFLTQYKPDKPDTCKDHLVWLHGYLDSYLKFVRELLQIQRDRVRGTADIVIDGQRSLESMVDHAATAIVNQLP